MSFLKFLFVPAFGLLSANAAAHSFSGADVHGKVMNAENQPMQYVVVTLLKTDDSTLVKGAVTDADGAYSMNGIEAGNYFVTASFTGYEKKWIGPVSISADADVPVENIVLMQSAEMSAVTISSVQPLFVQKPGMLIMNVENSPVRISGTAYDVICKAPGVTVDQDGNFSLQGRGGVQVYMDGKPTYLSGEQLRSYLQNIPAAGIIRVELMTTPPAKYDAEGSAGIINLVTKKSAQQGFNGSVSGGYGYGRTWKSEAGVSLNYGKPKFSVYAKYDLSTPRRKEAKFVTRNVPFGGDTTRYDQDVTLMMEPFSQHASVGVDFYPSVKTTWGVRADGFLFAQETNIETRNTVTQIDSNDINVLHQYNHLKGNFNNGSAGIYFRQDFDTNGTSLSANADYVLYNNRSHENYDLYFSDAGGNPLSSQFERALKSTDIGIYVGQVDYTHPFAKKYRIETGVKSSYVVTANDLAFGNQDPFSGEWTNDTARSNDFTYRELINAAYASCSADYSKWQLQLGLRAEQTISDGYSPTTKEDHKHDYIQLFPTLFVTQKINGRHSLQYSFSRRINRPAYDELNPFIFYVDQYTYHVGNPLLQPEIVNSLDITHNYADMLFTNVGVSRTTAGIAEVAHQVDSTGILNQSALNMNTIDYIYGSMTYSQQFTKWWINECNVSLTYARFRSNLYGVNVDKGNTVFNASLTETFLLPDKWKFEVSGWYQSKMLYTIFIIAPSGDVSVGLSKNFLKNKLRFSVNASDLFYTQTQRVSVGYSDQNLDAWHKFDSRVVYIRLRYNFSEGSATKKSQF
ncbi:MAG TPA: outer membrane beta-barrel family protein, partial [Bacteroidia bacterium]|nr:outer membrane beta-barrel family protein [Bacteroidia bacterium]